MLLKPELRSLNDRRIPVPWASGSTEVDSRANNYLSRLVLSDNSSVAELVLTPFPRQVWSDLWYVNLLNRETKGIVARFSDLMYRRNINIIGEDSSTTLQGGYHSSRIALDCRGYSSTADGNHRERRANPDARLQRLQDELVLVLLDDLRFFSPSFPCIAIERDLTLWSLESALTEAALTHPEEKVTIEHSCFEIPQRDIDRIKRKPRAGGEDSVPKALVSFAPESDLLRIVVFFQNQGIVPFALTFDNNPGAIAALTKALSDYDYNILASRFLSMDEERMYAWILMEQMGGDPTQKEDRMVSSRVSEIVMQAEEFGKFLPRLAAY